MSLDTKIRFQSFSESLAEDREEESIEDVYQEISNLSTLPSQNLHSHPHHLEMSTNCKTVTCNFTKFIVVFILLTFLTSLLITLLISFIVRCDENKVRHYYEEEKASKTINDVYSEFTDMWHRQEFEREALYKSGKLEWVSEKQLDKKKLDNLEPGGLERYGKENLLMFVARAAHLNGTVVGKYCPYLNRMYYGYSGKEHSTQKNYEVLRYPEGAVSWLPVKGKNLTVPLGSLVFGSESPFDGESTYICRIDLDRHLIIGKYLPSRSGCLGAYSMKLKEYDFSAENIEYLKDDFEILVINRMGEAMGVST